jgi:NTE family protein
VLAGGAALGAVQAGMVHALYERGITPDLLAGTSAGALNAAFPASRPPTVATAGELAAIWRGCGAATSAPPAHGRGLGTMRPRISAKP